MKSFIYLFLAVIALVLVSEPLLFGSDATNQPNISSWINSVTPPVVLVGASESPTSTDIILRNGDNVIQVFRYDSGKIDPAAKIISTSMKPGFVIRPVSNESTAVRQSDNQSDASSNSLLFLFVIVLLCWILCS